MTKVILCAVLLAVAAATYTLFLRNQSKLEANPKLEPGMEFRTFATLWHRKGESDQLVCLVAHDGTCRQVPTAWKTAMEGVVEGQAVALPPAWHLWRKTSDKNVITAAEQASNDAKRGVMTLPGRGEGYYYCKVFHAPAPKKQDE